jgi:cysteine desulfurase
MKMPIYMDHNATTPVDPRVLEAMLPTLTEQFGNPASAAHPWGWAASRLVERARELVASGVGGRAEEVVFTSGATEANNLAIKGVAHALRARGRHLVTVATEHHAVLDPHRALEREGFEVTVLPVDGVGRVDPGAVVAALRSDTTLVSVMLANNETGVLQPLAEIGRTCRERGVLLLTDATQAVGKIRVDVAELDVDLLSMSAHKLYGPKGVGALWVRRWRPRLHLEPLLDGGGHEGGLRSGTLNVPGIVGFGKAMEIAGELLEGESRREWALVERLRDGILDRLGGVVVNTPPSDRLPNTLSLSFSGVDSGALIAGVKAIAVSSGSACSSARPEPSHVLRALGREPGLAAASLRFSIGRSTTAEDVGTAVDEVARVVGELRRGSVLAEGGVSR